MIFGFGKATQPRVELDSASPRGYAARFDKFLSGLSRVWGINVLPMKARSW